jgi:hypothetical protein
MNERKRENMPKELKPIPTFQSEDEECEFWATHDSTEYIDWDKADYVKTYSGISCAISHQHS